MGIPVDALGSKIGQLPAHVTHDSIVQLGSARTHVGTAAEMPM